MPRPTDFINFMLHFLSFHNNSCQNNVTSAVLPPVSGHFVVVSPLATCTVGLHSAQGGRPTPDSERTGNTPHSERTGLTVLVTAGIESLILLCNEEEKVLE